MSKKSRRRNKKILATIAALGGAAMLANRRGTAAANVDSGRGSGLRDTVDSNNDWITKKNVETSVEAPIKKPVDTGFQTRFTAKGDDGVWRGPGATKNYYKLRAGNKVPPSMRGGAETAQGFVRKVPISRGRGKGSIKYGYSTEPYKKSIFGNLYKKGGRVKLAKRGLGRAFTKSKK